MKRLPIWISQRTERWRTWLNTWKPKSTDTVCCGPTRMRSKQSGEQTISYRADFVLTSIRNGYSFLPCNIMCIGRMRIRPECEICERSILICGCKFSAFEPAVWLLFCIAVSWPEFWIHNQYLVVRTVDTPNADDYVNLIQSTLHLMCS